MRQMVIVVLGLVMGWASLEAQAASPDEVNLLAMGDWGRGNALQKTVAGTMAKYVGSLDKPVDACLLAGDNFYVPLASTKDPNWGLVFEKMYDAKKLKFPFYASLGNHDYQNVGIPDVAKNEVEAAYARENPTSRWKLPADWYRVDFPAEGKPLVSVLMLNSNQPKLTPAQWAEELSFIDKELADRRGAVWMVACAHHPLFSNGAHGDNGVLQTQWGSLFQKHKLDFYVAGHDHDLQQLQLKGKSTTFLMVGGGGATTRPMLRDNRGPFSQPAVGFTHLELTESLATVTYVSGLDGSVLHEFTRSPDTGKLTVVKGGAISPATTKPLKVIQGVGQKKDDD